MPPRNVVLNTFPPSGLYGSPIQARVFPNPNGIVPQDSDAPMPVAGHRMLRYGNYQVPDPLMMLLQQQSPFLVPQMQYPINRYGIPDGLNPFLVRQF
jgi:hypothetical protein